METAQPTAAVTPDSPPASGASAVAGGSALARIAPAAAFLFAFLALWIVQHPTVGYTHDSSLYLIQALARLDPALFAHDIFLRYGSQDRFTVFSPLFAWGMQLFGVERAAPIFAFVAQAGFFAATAVLARMLVPARLVWPSLVLVCVLPGFYGGGQIFKLVEEFATPRLFAEAFVVAGLAAFLKRRFLLAAAFGVLGLVLHPLMTVGGIAVALFTNITPPRVRVLAIAGGALGAGALFAWMGLHGQQIRFDEQWVRLLRSGLSYLWPSNWTMQTWPTLLVTLATLVIGGLTLERSDARSLCRAGLIAGIAGVAFQFVAGDLLEIILVLQSQPYRWLWVSTLLATLLLPLIAYRLWSQALFGRVTVLLLTAAWLCTRESYGIGIALLALLAAVATAKATTPLPQRTQRLILFGAAAVLAIAVIYHVATLSLFAVVEDFSEGPQWLRTIRTYSRTGALPLAVFLLIYVTMGRARSRIPRWGITAGCLVMFAALLPASAHEWSVRWYGRDYQAFAGWRALIPPGTEVFWFDGPVSTWMLLQRPSYLSNMQDTSGVFSRPAAMASKHRVDALASYIDTEPSAAWREKQLDGTDSEKDVIAREHDPVPLAPLCAAAPDLRFIVTRKDMKAVPLATAPPDASYRYRDYRLFRCDPPHD